MLASVFISSPSPSLSSFLIYFGGFWMNFEEIPFLLLLFINPFLRRVSNQYHQV